MVRLSVRSAVCVHLKAEDYRIYPYKAYGRPVENNSVGLHISLYRIIFTVENVEATVKLLMKMV